MKRKANLIFIILFLMIISLPYLFAHRNTQGRISDMENRTLSGYPSLLLTEGGMNREYTSQFEDWLDDNLRGRSILIKANATIQYLLFQNIVKTDTLQGENGWLFVNSDDQIREYQHSNLMSEQELAACALRLQKLSDYLKEKGIAFYYFQCYSKETIYPDMYNKGILQVEDISRTEQVMDVLQRETDIRLIDSKKVMKEHGADQIIYFQYVDALHWNEEGAYWGYRELMNEIHKDFEQVPVLEKEDYQIHEEERGTSIYGFEYPYRELCPVYQLAAPRAIEVTKDTLNDWDWLYFKEHTHEYVNEGCENNLKILMVGDSYIRMFLKDDIAESFSATLSVDWLNVPIIDKIVEEYQPDVVILECVDSTLGNVMELTKQMDFIEE